MTIAEEGSMHRVTSLHGVRDLFIACFADFYVNDQGEEPPRQGSGGKLTNNQCWQRAAPLILMKLFVQNLDFRLPYANSHGLAQSSPVRAHC